MEKALPGQLRFNSRERQRQRVLGLLCLLLLGMGRRAGTRVSRVPSVPWLPDQGALPAPAKGFTSLLGL